MTVATGYALAAALPGPVGGAMALLASFGLWRLVTGRTVPSLERFALPSLLTVGVVLSIASADIGRIVGTGTALLAAVAVYRLPPRLARFAPGIVWLAGSTVIVATFPNNVLDVWFLHRDAAEILSAGGDPFTDLRVVNGAPSAAPDDLITGYPYPPLVLGFVTFARSIFAEFRIGFAIAWAVTLLLAGWKATSPSALRVLAAMSAIPLVAQMLWASWTEPLSLMLLTMSLVAFQIPWLSSVFLGLALASKQYFAPLAPLLLSWRPVAWVRRSMVTVLAIMVALVPALWSLEGFVDSNIVFHLTQGVRSDSSNLIGIVSRFGLDSEVVTTAATLTGLLLALAVSVCFGRRIRSASDFAAVSALSLGATFLLSSQTFGNYWFLLSGLLFVGAILEDGSTVESHQELERQDLKD